MARRLGILISVVLIAAALLPCHARHLSPSLGDDAVESSVSQGRKELAVDDFEGERELLEFFVDYVDPKVNPSVDPAPFFNLPKPPPEPPSPVVTWIHNP
eukprot:TRINITY_DN3688_c0_g1_i1.p1 TRINITY_DN3688_c0_g1~~TRINITY_DN3688_c0_g1_i1.p1  ORF type:complete len:100 (-),score=9.47 TRINITY_DN3688_c0_g1_i1:311-610(-)